MPGCKACPISFWLTELGKFKEGAPKDLNKTNKNPKENPYQPMDFKNLEKKICKPKVSRLLQNVCNFQKENHTLWYGLKIYRNL
jgi:hypothetical protein